MKFLPTAVEGVFIVEPERLEDARGFFARIFCRREFAEHGLEGDLTQCSLSRNHKRGTLRGMHFQGAPHEETKLVRCTAGAIYDVALDLRPGSRSYGKCATVELSSSNARSLYIPRGCAHGFQTLTAAAEVLYHITDTYAPEHARGVRWNDPAFGIEWPIGEPILNDRDRNWPLT